jgi:hypothetical protein
MLISVGVIGILLVRFGRFVQFVGFPARHFALSPMPGTGSLKPEYAWMEP